MATVIQTPPTNANGPHCRQRTLAMIQFPPKPEADSPNDPEGMGSRFHGASWGSPVTSVLWGGEDNTPFAVCAGLGIIIRIVLPGADALESTFHVFTVPGACPTSPAVLSSDGTHIYMVGTFGRVLSLHLASGLTTTRWRSSPPLWGKDCVSGIVALPHGDVLLATPTAHGWALFDVTSPIPRNSISHVPFGDNEQSPITNFVAIGHREVALTLANGKSLHFNITHHDHQSTIDMTAATLPSWIIERGAADSAGRWFQLCPTSSAWATCDLVCSASPCDGAPATSVTFPLVARDGVSWSMSSSPTLNNIALDPHGGRAIVLGFGDCPRILTHPALGHQ